MIERLNDGQTHQITTEVTLDADGTVAEARFSVDGDWVADADDGKGDSDVDKGNL